MPAYMDHAYPSWGIVIGWCVAAMSMLPIPFFMLVEITRHLLHDTDVPLVRRVCNAFLPNERWLQCVWRNQGPCTVAHLGHHEGLCPEHNGGVCPQNHEGLCPNMHTGKKTCPMCQEEQNAGASRVMRLHSNGLENSYTNGSSVGELIPVYELSH